MFKFEILRNDNRYKTESGVYVSIIVLYHKRINRINFSKFTCTIQMRENNMNVCAAYNM